MNQHSCILTKGTTQPLGGSILTIGQSESQVFTGSAVFKDNPFQSFSGNYQIIEFIEGSTAEEIVDLACQGNSWLKNYIVVKVGDQLVPKESWSRVKLKRNAPILLMVIPQGGGAGNILKTLALITVAVVANAYIPGAGGSIAAKIGHAVGVAAVTMGASLALNAVFPPPVADKPQLGNGLGEADTFSWNSSSNQLLTYQSVPRVYGRVKMAPPYAAKPFVESIGAEQYLYLIFDFGYGELQLEDLRIGENPLDTFQNVQYYIHPAFKKGDSLNLYNRDVYQENYSQKLLQSAWRYGSSTQGTSEAVIDFNFPLGLNKINQSTADVLTHEVDLSVEWRAVGDSVWSDFSTLSRQISGGNELEYTGAFDTFWDSTSPEYSGAANFPVYDSLPNPNIVLPGESISIRLTREQFNGESYDTVTTYQDYLRNSEVNRPKKKIRISNRTQKPFNASLVLQWQQPGEFEFRFSRLTADSDDRYISDDVYFASIRSIKKMSPIAPEKPHTIVEMRILANDQLSGVVDNFTAVATSILPVWNGRSYAMKPTRNPAWIYLDILRGTAATKPVAESRIDLNSFIEWAAWCASPALNAPGMPKSQCDLIVSGNTTTWDILKTVAATGDATPATRSGKHSISIDREKNYPVQMFTPRNSSQFTSTKTFFTKPDALRVQFVDPGQEWQQREIIVYDDGFDETNAKNFETLSLVGVTNYHHAYRLGRRSLAQAKLRPETFTITVGMEHILATRGDLVRFAYDIPKIGNGWARIKSVAGQNIKIDEQITNIRIGDYLRIRVYHHLQVDLVVTDVVDDQTFVVDGDTSQIEKNMLAIYGSMEKMSMDCIVKAVQPGYDLTAQIDLVPYAPEIYRAEVDEIPEYDPLITNLENVRPGPVINLQASEIDTVVNRYHYISISLSWNKPAGSSPSLYEIYEVQNNVWVKIGETKELSYFAYKEIKSIKDNGSPVDFIGRKMTFAVVGVAAIGLKIQPAQAAQVTITPVGDNVKPTKPLKFDLDMKSSNQIYLDWRHPNFNDISHYVIRYSPKFGAAAIDDSTIVAHNIAYPTDSVTVPARLGTYFIRTVDTSGNISDDYGAVITPSDTLSNEQEILTVEDEVWNGPRYGFDLLPDNGGLYMPVAGVPNQNGYYSATYYFNEFIFFDALYSVFLKTHIEATPSSSVNIPAMDYYYDVFIEGRASNETVTIGGWGTLDTVVPDLSTGSMDFTPFRRIYAGEYIGNYFQFRLVAISNRPDVAISVKTARIIGTADIRTESDFDDICPPEGKQIYYDVPFYDTASVQVTQSDVIVGDTYTISNKNDEGFFVRFFNDGTGVERQFDWLARGYGKKVNNIPR